MITERRDLLLLGGGHTHALALRMLAMEPPPGVRLTLVSDTAFAPYSGMLPGLVAGHYRFEDTHIDLRRFCSTRGVRFVEARACGIDVSTGRVLLEDRPPLEYDFLSINIGAQPELDSVPGAREHAIPVKPVGSFYRRWQQLRERLADSPGATPRILLVGGGAGSVELALAMRHRLGSAPDISLVCGESLLPDYNRGAREVVRRSCLKHRVALLESARVTAVEAGRLWVNNEDSVEFDELVWCTGAVPVNWLADTGLPVDERGFLMTDDTLQVTGCPGIFSAGDVAVQTRHPRPRAGVYAVRQAPVLARNLSALARQRPLRKHRPQRRFLSLLSLGEQRAVADRGPLWASGAWVWRWKDHIDRRFMAKFCEPPPAMAAPAAGPDMHCGGCGAKLPASLLRGALAEVATLYPAHVAPEQLGDDAAILDWPAGKSLVQTVDTLRALVDDPWLMGRITAVHALSDLYAIGAAPLSAQVHVCLGYAAPALQSRELVQLMSGLVEELARAGCRLVGGHSMEGPELSLGLTLNGIPGPGKLPKSGARVGDKLLLTKPLGTGVIFAAAMVGGANGASLAAAINSMLRSNRDAALLAVSHGVNACTDVTGFGLAGHLREMLEPGQQARLTLEQLPLLEGAETLWQTGYRSTLHAGNAASANLDGDWPPAMFDPQTSGGLLLAQPPEGADALLRELRDSGHQAAVIGEVVARPAAGVVIAAG